MKYLFFHATPYADEYTQSVANGTEPLKSVAWPLIKEISYIITEDKKVESFLKVPMNENNYTYALMMLLLACGGVDLIVCNTEWTFKLVAANAIRKQISSNKKTAKHYMNVGDFKDIAKMMETYFLIKK